ncbi:ribonuclease J [Patescibacteria group bacterium]
MRFYNVKENKKSSSKDSLKIILIGGTETVQKNLAVYEYKDDMVIVDCGIGFPDIFDMPGVDFLIPDFTYLIENQHKIKGVFITHAHEDHMGAVPNLLQELPDIPIYASKLVGESLKAKVKDKRYGNLGKRDFTYHLMDPTTGEVDLGSFKLSAFRINHSVPESMGFAIKTPQGLFLHIADYKFDATPVLDKPIDIEAIKKYADDGVMCLLSDCLLVTEEGHTESEKTLTETFFKLFERAGKRQVFVTTISSNVSRIYQVMDAAKKYGRKVVPSGWSVEQMVRVARSLGYLPFPDDFFVEERDSRKYPQEQLVYLVAGCYGQHGSSLDRLSRGEHRDISLQEDALVIFSGDPAPPGTGVMVEKVMDALTLKGAEIVYGEIQDNLHVSGHARRDDIGRMVKLVHPKYFIPIGGTITKMRFYTKFLETLGFSKNQVFECLEGDSVEFSGGKAQKGKHYNTKPVYLDGSKAEELDPIVIDDRNHLCNDGVFVVAVPVSKKGIVFSGKLEIITRGFIYVKGSKELMDKSKKHISKKLAKMSSKSKNISDNKKKLESDIRNFLYKQTGMSPLVIVHFITI